MFRHHVDDDAEKEPSKEIHRQEKKGKINPEKLFINTIKKKKTKSC